ncbi:peptidylprolyl isomerase [Geitlerinema calcuttense]|uniref:Peptidylprolyl isomerase n=1 Tax=Geitlerinema calcuttense NRMC-F 0142 TaxID=2922238 RepID=A0ABT7LYH6_9CYAN|nr:peptidylprolyl isomerase [Geitlerinema calcuttense]MDL5057069.1 peptidylprolyl isomerase [Geitlerinema calcuttense NRMC-F 0142]
MANLPSLSLETEEIIDFLRRDLRLKDIYQEIASQKIINQTAQEQGLTVTSNEIQAELDRIRYEKCFDSPSVLLNWLDRQRVTLNELRQRIGEHLLTKKLANYLFSEKVDRLFSEHRSDFEQVLLYKIVVPYEQLANNILYQIIEEEVSFYEAAHLYDIDEKRRLHCGYEGKKRRCQLNPELAETLFNANTGEVIGPLKSFEKTYELFLVEEFSSPGLTTEIYEETLNGMFKEWLEAKLH